MEERKIPICPQCSGKGYLDSTYNDMNHPLCEYCKGSGSTPTPPQEQPLRNPLAEKIRQETPPEINEEIDRHFEMLDNQEQAGEEEKNKCFKCGGRTALMSGFWSYSADDEPYENGVIEQAIAKGGDKWICGYKCDNCGNIQGLWHE